VGEYGVFVRAFAFVLFHLLHYFFFAQTFNLSHCCHKNFVTNWRGFRI